MPSRLSILKRLAFALVLSGIALLSAEGGARLLGKEILNKAASPPPERQDQAPNLQGNPYLLWEMSPGIRHEMGVTVNISTLGFRGPERAIPKPDGIRRILAVGDSSVFGFGVEDTEVFTALLEESLGRYFEVVNCAIPGYSSFQTLNLLQIRALSLEPDVLVIATQWSDNNFDAFVDKEMMAAYSTFGNSNARKMRSVLEKSHLFRVLDYQLRVAKVLPDARKVGWMLGRGEHIGPRRVELNDYARNIETMVELVHERKGQVILMILANQEDIEPKGDGPAAWDPYRQVLRDTADRHGAPLIDMPAILKETGKGIAELFLDEMHPSPAGHALMAEALERVLRERGWSEGGSLEIDPKGGSIPEYVDRFIQGAQTPPPTDGGIPGASPSENRPALGDPRGPADGVNGLKMSGVIVAPQYTKGSIQLDVISTADSSMAGAVRVNGPGPFEAAIPSRPKQISFIVYLDENSDGPGPGDRRITLSKAAIDVPESGDLENMSIDLSGGDEIQTFSGEAGSPPLEGGAAAPNPATPTGPEPGQEPSQAPPPEKPLEGSENPVLPEPVQPLP